MLVIILSIVMLPIVGCENPNNTFTPSIYCKYDYYDLIVGESIEINELYTTNIDKELVNISVSNNVLKVSDSSIIATSIGTSVIKLLFDDGNYRIERTISVNVKEKTIFATSIMCEEKIYKKLGDVFYANSLYQIIPNEYTENASVYLTGKACVIDKENKITVDNVGSSYLLIVVKKSSSEYISKTIEIIVEDVEDINITAEIVDKFGNEIDTIYDNEEYILKVNANKDLYISKFNFSKGINLKYRYYEDGYYKFLVMLENKSEFIITYADKEEISYKILNTYNFVSQDKFSCYLNNIEKVDGVYIFNLGNGNTSKYTTNSEIILKLNEINVEEFDLDFSACNDIITLESGLLSPICEGNGKLLVKYRSYIFELNICVSKVYVEKSDIELNFEKVMYYSLNNINEIVITNLDEEKFMYDEIELSSKTENIKIENLIITVLDNTVKDVICTLNIGEIELPIEIKVIAYKIDDVKIKYNNSYVENILIKSDSIIYLEYYYLNEFIDIDENLDVVIVVDDLNIVKTSSTVVINYFYIYSLSSGETYLKIYNGDELIKSILITVE